jgi:hypothetical protein
VNGVSLAEIRAGAAEEAAALAAGKPRPYRPPTPAAYASAEAQMDILAGVGMPRSADLVECLATIIDVHSALTELTDACVGAWELCRILHQGGKVSPAGLAGITECLRGALVRAGIQLERPEAQEAAR